MNKLHNDDTKRFFEAILQLQNTEECRLFFEDICTVKEIQDISQRLKAAKMLSEGENYTVVSKETGMSTATISRVNKCLGYGGGGYKLVLDRLENKEESENE